MSPQQQYEDYLKGFSYNLDKLCNKVALFTYLKENLSGDKVELAPVLFLPFIESLLVDSVVSIARLYELRSDRNLARFLDFVEGNLKFLTWQHEPITKEMLASQKHLIASKEQAATNVRSQRDKYFAHHDKEYFVDASKLGQDYPVTVRDVEELIYAAQEINCSHHLALNGTMPMPLHEMYVISLDNIFQILQDHRSRQLLLGM